MYGEQQGGWTYSGLKRAANGKVMPVADHAPHAGASGVGASAQPRGRGMGAPMISPFVITTGAFVQQIGPRWYVRAHCEGPSGHRVVQVGPYDRHAHAVLTCSEVNARVGAWNREPAFVISTPQALAWAWGPWCEDCGKQAMWERDSDGMFLTHLADEPTDCPGWPYVSIR